MAIFSDTFESNNLSAWGGSTAGAGNTIATTSAQKRNGVYGLQSTTVGVQNAYCSYYYGGANQNKNYYRFWFRIPTGSTVASYVNVIDIQDGLYNNRLSLSLDTSVKLACSYYDHTGLQHYTGALTATLADSTWHDIYITNHVINATTGTVVVSMDGAVVFNLSSIDTGTAGTHDIHAINLGSFYSNASESISMYFDDFAWDNIPIPALPQHLARSVNQAVNRSNTY